MWKKVVLMTLLGLVLVSTQGVEKRRTGNVCRTDFECPDNSFCKDASYCMCKEGNIFVSINDTHKGCLPEARFGDPCIKDIQCHVMMSLRAECANGVCRCSANSHLEMDKCYQNAVVGERCMVDANCYLGEPNPGEDRESFCVRGYCVCPMNYSPRDNGTRCVRDAHLDEPCEDNMQCAGPGLECRGTCQCRDQWVPHIESKRCIEAKSMLVETPVKPMPVEVPKIHTKTQTSVKPPNLQNKDKPTSIEIGNVEHHYKGYIPPPGILTQRVLVTKSRLVETPVKPMTVEVPKTQTSVKPPNSKSKEKLVSIVTGKNTVEHHYKGYSRSVLISVKALGDPCEYDAQCYQFAGSPDARTPGTALCLGGVCSCAYNARKVGDFCWPRRRPGTHCLRDEECVSEEDEPGYCLNGICTCKNCGPDDKDFYGGASTLSRPPVIAAAIFSIAAILGQ